MRVALLGPLVLSSGAETPTSRQERAVIEVLALAAPRVTASGTLRLALWGDEEPPSARKTLQAVISRLRRGLPEGAVTMTGDGYLLHVAPEDVDVNGFVEWAAEGRSALDDGDIERAIRQLGRALALWRGTPLADVDDTWSRGEVTRLEEIQRTAHEDLLVARLAEGAAGAVVADAQAAVIAEPLRERRWVTLVRALAASGRTAEALRTYRSAVESLADVGLEPGAELQAAERAIFTSAASTGDPAWRPRALGPKPRTSLVGREDVRALVHRLIGGHRLVTVTGPAGVGKTRLAVEIGHDELARGAARVVFVDLTEARSDGDVGDVVAEAASAKVDPGVDLSDATAEVLRAQPVLLVLDNCEHVLDGAADVADVLIDRCPLLTVLATSRERLGVAAEQVVPLAPLRTADPAGVTGVDATGPSEAACLFLDRIEQLDPGLNRATLDLEDLESVCRRVDGLPLAIELAATTVPSLGLAEVERRLSDRFGLLRVDRAYSDGRHRTLEAAIEASWSTLTPADRTALDQLSVLQGSFGLPAIEAVACGPDGDGPANLAARLVAKSLLVVDQLEPEPRYRLLESIRDFAAGELERAGRLDDTLRRHADWILALAGEAAAGLAGPDQAAWLDRLEPEQPNIEAALAWCAQRPARSADALRATVGLFNFWFVRGTRRDAGVAWCTRFAESAVEVPVVERVQALVLAAMILAHHDARALRALADRATTLAGNDRQAWALAGVARIWSSNSTDPGSHTLEIAEEILADIPSGYWENVAQCSLGYGLGAAGRWEEGFCHGRAEARILLADDEHLGGGYLAVLADYGIAAGLAEEAEADARLALAIADRFACPSCGLCALVDLALLDAVDEWGGPVAALRSAIRMAEGIGEIRGTLHSVDALIGAFASTGEPQQALVLNGALTSAYERTGFMSSLPGRARARWRGVELAIGAVGPDEAADLDARGRSLTHRELVELALAEAPPP